MSRTGAVVSWLTLRQRRGLPGTAAWRENRAERLPGHPVALVHDPHLEAACDWLARAQDAHASGGIARGYSVIWHPYFRVHGWEPEYPETTGYIIPTFYMIADHLGRPEFAARAERAARWECAVQLQDGAVQAGVIGEPAVPAVFNTGQVIFGWLAAFERTGDQCFADAAHRAAEFLVKHIDEDGIWRRATSHLANPAATLYNTRTAWALAEAGVRLGVPRYVEAARKALLVAVDSQHANGWLPDCCLWDAEQPLLHTLAYAIRGLLEGGLLLGDEQMVAQATTAAGALRDAVTDDGWLAGRWAAGWIPVADFSCLTGNAQMANIWLRLAQFTEDRSWLCPVERVLRFLERTQNRTTANDGLRGGIKGSFPFSGAYGQYEVLNWATKFFVDAVIRYERLIADAPALSAASLA